MTGGIMKPTRQLRDLGQSLWLDNVTCSLLTDGYLAEVEISAQLRLNDGAPPPAFTGAAMSLARRSAPHSAGLEPYVEN
jgi:hypothetical protein